MWKMVYKIKCNKNQMADKWLERPRELIISETNRFDVRNPERMSLLVPRRNKRFTLPPIHNQSQCRRFKTMPPSDCFPPQSKPSQLDLNHLKRALKLSHSRILTQISQRLPSLQSMGLMQGGKVRTIRYSGHIRMPTVDNDYHCSKTNAGYSRNKYGGIYPK